MHHVSGNGICISQLGAIVVSALCFALPDDNGHHVLNPPAPSAGCASHVAELKAVCAGHSKWFQWNTARLALITFGIDGRTMCDQALTGDVGVGVQGWGC